MYKYELPDGQVMMIGTECFQCPEPLFQPRLVQLTSKGIHDLVYESVLQCENRLRWRLLNNVVVCGGGMSFPGMVVRLKNELNTFNVAMDIDLVNGFIRESYASKKQIVHRDIVSVILTKCGSDCNVTVCECDAAWKGGSLLANRSEFRNQWITKESYQENGACDARIAVLDFM